MPSKNDIMFLDEIIKENDWKDLQRHNILRALRASNGKIQGKFAASELLGIKPTTLRSRMESLGISKREYIY
jgi:transcriptional regulator with GAF, ATPase, and Fis domain